MGLLSDLLGAQLRTGSYLIEKFTADLSDAEYFRPAFVAGTHIAWLVGHVARTEERAVATLDGAAPQFPPNYDELFKAGSACTTDAAHYPSRAEIDAWFRRMRERTVQLLSTFDERRLGEPSPESPVKKFFPTLGAMWGLIGTHQFWHIGQIANCRRALGKPGILG